MPLTEKGKKIRKAMRKTYGPKKGDSVFYASRNSGKIKGVDRSRPKKKTRSEMYEAMRGD